MIEAVAVDLGGVAAAFHPERRLRALAERSGIAPAVIHERLFTSGLDARAERGEIPFDALAEQICAALEGRLETSEIIDCWASAFEPLEAVLVSVASIRVATVLLTNNGPVINACLDGPLSAIAVEFDRVICSWQLGACKPERTAFDRAAVLLGRRGVPVLGADDGPLVRAPRRGRTRTSAGTSAHLDSGSRFPPPRSIEVRGRWDRGGRMDRRRERQRASAASAGAATDASRGHPPARRRRRAERQCRTNGRLAERPRLDAD